MKHWTQMDITETQNKTVLKHLIKYGSITAEQAVRKYSIYRLGARIYDLKKRGEKIHSKLIFNKTNPSCHWSEYSLIS